MANRHHQQVSKETDLTKIDGLPQPAADQFRVPATSDLTLYLRFPGAQAEVSFRGSHSPLQTALALTFGTVPAAGMGLIMHEIGLPSWESVIVTGVIWVATTWIIFRGHFRKI